MMALAAAAALSPLSHSLAAERNAVIQGDLDRPLRQALEQAVGEARDPPDSRLAARSRARDAAAAAETLLRSEGYYQGRATPDIGEGERPPALVRIEPGPRFRLAGPSLEWVSTAPDPEAQAAADAALALPDGGPGRAAEVISAEARALSVLQQRGYADAAAAPRRVVVDHADQTVRPAFRLDAGPLVRLGGVEIQNQGRTDPAFIRRLAPWRVGDVYRPDDVAELERRLLDTQAYDAVTVGLRPADAAAADGPRPVLVGVVDRARRLIEVGGGYSTSQGYEFDVRASVFNRLRRADTAAVQARYGTITSRLGADLSLPHWRRPGETLKLTAEVFRDRTQAYDQEGGALRADLTRRRGPNAYFTRGLSLVRSFIDEARFGDTDAYSVVGLVALALDHSSDPLDPRRGWRLEVRGQPTLTSGDNTLAYLKMQAQASAYLPADADRTVLAGRVRLGAIAGGVIPNVPAGDRFYAGGGGSVRGYAYQGVGPRYDDGVPTGGLSLFEASLEVRRRVTGAFGAVAFVDAGSVGQAVNPDFNNLQYGVGVGLRYNLGFAPIRADVAVPLDRPAGDNPFQLYFSIGQAF